jgi:transcriptional regulator with XRE-family HTH domain
MYMATKYLATKYPATKSAATKSPATKSKPLRWRTNCIRHWRDFRDGMTLEAAAEALSRPPYNLDYTHNSLGRIENGKQMPTIELIEALARLYRTDIDSLLNRRPETADREPAPTARGLLQLWDKAAADERGLIIDVARKVVKTGT